MGNQSHNVLIADDEEDISEFLAEYMLEKGGYNILEASSLEQTLTILRNNHNVDIVVLDLIMADSKGLEAIMAIKNEIKEMPIIVLTGYPGLHKKSSELGVFAHIEKPFSPKDIEIEIAAKL